VREIKFRAWDKRLKQFLFDGSGFAVIGEVTCFNMVDQYCAENKSGCKTSLDRIGDIEIMQFTGLLDKNGKEIYEGDIVKFSIEGDETESPVEWELGGFCVGDGTGYKPYLGETYMNRCVVIGNIYEN
jgi:uncharacterized phage protein (TIGR01671 family)